MSRPRICLSMIVKDEFTVLRRCLNSVLPYVDAWAICDTGSSDGTQALVRELCAALPGELAEHPWKNFAHNRNQALELARCRGDYALVIDADDVLEVTEPAPRLDAEGYFLDVQDHDTRYARVALVRLDVPWRWVGAVHEVLTLPGVHRTERLAGWAIRRLSGGARSAVPGQKFLRDIALLEEARREDPSDARTVFYLAQSHRDAGHLDRAIEVYRERVAMGGWDEEVFCAQLEVARGLERLGRWPEALEAYLAAYAFRPTRAEPLYELARRHRQHGQHAAALLFAERAAASPRPNDRLFVEDSVYAWRARDELAIALYWTGRVAEARRLNKALLASDTLPEGERARVLKNLEFCLKKT